MVNVQTVESKALRLIGNPKIHVNALFSPVWIAQKFSSTYLLLSSSVFFL